MPRLARLLLGLVVTASAFGCDRDPSSADRNMNSTVRGTLSYLERIALTPQAEAEVQLLEVPRSGGPAPVIGLMRIQNPGEVPIPFEIHADLQLVDPEAGYAIQAYIRERGQTLFRSPGPVPVSAAEGDRTVELVLHRAQTLSAPGAPSYDCSGVEPFWQASIEGDRLRFHRLVETPVYWEFDGHYRVQGRPGATSVVWHGIDRARPVHRLTAWITEDICEAKLQPLDAEHRYTVSITLPDVNVVRGCCRRIAPSRPAAKSDGGRLALRGSP